MKKNLLLTLGSAALAALAGLPLAAQGGTDAGPGNGAPTAGALLGAESPFQGGVPVGTATAGAIELSLADALERGLRNNLGQIESDLTIRESVAEVGRARSSLLPKLSARAYEQTQKISLVTFGLEIPGVPQLIGPFSYEDARVSITQSLVDLESLRSFRAAKESARAAQLAAGGVRDSVVLAVGAAYFQVAASQARLETARAQLKSSQTLEQLAASQVKSGLSPSIDSFRATVERQSNEQRAAVAEATLEKDKLILGRAIGLPPGQRFTLTTVVTFKPWDGPALEDALRQAGETRTDLKSAEAAVHAAELAKSAAEAQHLPSLAVSADYGQVGKTYAHTDGTFTVGAGLTVPLYNGGKSRAAVEQADTVLARRRAEYENLKGRIDYEVRSALLDLAAAETSVKVAQQNIELAGKTLAQAQDRFANGVTNNVEVVLAQGAVTAAGESYIVSLFSHNLAKLQLLRAMGLAEQGVKQYLSGQTVSGPTEGAKR